MQVVDLDVVVMVMLKEQAQDLVVVPEV